MTSSIELLASTGNSQTDDILRGLIVMYQTVFPARLRSLYVVGSYSDGSAVPDSDLDLGVVFDSPLAEEDLTRFRQMNQAAALISPIRLDCGTVSPERFKNGIPAGLKSALVVYGEDLFAGLPLEPVEAALRRGMSNTFHSLYVLRQRNDKLVFPLRYPDPDGEFYGYERWGTYLGARSFGPGVRSLVTSVTLIASCFVMLEAETHVGSKKESVSAYQSYVGDEWTDFVQQAYAQCKQAWHYQLPEATKARRQFRRLCAKMLDFENHFLSRCRELLISDLRHKEKEIQEMALYRLHRVAYPGEEFTAALMTIMMSDDTNLARRAETIVAKLHSN